MVGLLLAVSVGVAFVVAAAVGLRLFQVARTPSPARPVLTAEEIQSETDRLTASGLRLPSSFFSERPFEAPWTSRSLLVPAAWLREPGIKRFIRPSEVRADLLLADLDVLEPVMARAYGGWDTAIAGGWDWTEWFASWRQSLVSHGDRALSLNEAFAPMDALMAFQRDNHTTVPLARWQVDGSHTARLTALPDAPCSVVRTSEGDVPLDGSDAGLRVRSAKVWRPGTQTLDDGRYVVLPSSAGRLESVQCGDKSIPLLSVSRPASGLWTMATTQAAAWLAGDTARVERLDDGVVYARVPTLSHGNYAGLVSDDWPNRETDDRVLIVDLRDNGGGSYEYARRVLDGWIDLADATVDTFGLTVNESCLYPPLKWGFNMAFGSSGTTTEGWQALVDQIGRPSPDGCPRRVRVSEPRWRYSDRLFAPDENGLRVIALVNSQCGSDCELIAAMLATSTQAIVAGSNTLGIMQFTQPGYSVLPHTGLAYRLALGTSDIYGDGRSVDGYGLDVDILIPGVDRLDPHDLLDLAHVVRRWPAPAGAP